MIIARSGKSTDIIESSKMCRVKSGIYRPMREELIVEGTEVKGKSHENPVCRVFTRSAG